MVTYKGDILAKLKQKGYTSYRLRQEKIFGERVIQQLRQKEPFSWEVLNRLCALLECQPGDLLEFVREESEEGTRETKPWSERTIQVEHIER